MIPVRPPSLPPCAARPAAAKVAAGSGFGEIMSGLTTAAPDSAEADDGTQPDDADATPKDGAEEGALPMLALLVPGYVAPPAPPPPTPQAASGAPSVVAASAAPPAAVRCSGGSPRGGGSGR